MTRAQKVPLWEVLRDVRAGRVNYVSDRHRLAEVQAVVAYWPWEMLRPLSAAHVEGVWHVLLEPTRWQDVASAEVHAFAREWLESRGRWPDVGTQRARFGRARNHRLPGESPEQETLPL